MKLRFTKQKRRLRPEILLHPNIPKPLHGLAPRTIKGARWWDMQRIQAYARAGYCCQACGVPEEKAKYHQWLEAHELYEFDYAKGRMTFVELVALCHSCHNFIHSGRMQALVEKGEMSEAKHRAITEHGNRLIAHLDGLPLPTFVAPWSEWRLVFEGKEYKGQFATYSDWYKHFYGELPPHETELSEALEEVNNWDFYLAD